MGEGDIRQQLGEIIATLRAIEARQSDRDREAREADERLNAELRNVKHDARNVQQVMSGKLDLMDIQLRALRVEFDGSVLTVKRETQTLHEEIAAIKKPVDEMMMLRIKVGAVVVACITAIGAVYAAAAPFVSALVDRMFKTHA